MSADLCPGTSPCRSSPAGSTTGDTPDDDIARLTEAFAAFLVTALLALAAVLTQIY